jgi:glyoxylase-like metal-dependent hydrolase (beta-lactamase superfamily II)
MRAAIAASLLFALSAAPSSRAQEPAIGSPPAPTSGRLMAPERVTDRVWVMRQPDRLWAAVIGNVTIIEQENGLVLVDSGGSIPDGRDIVKAVAALSPKPIKAVAITHWHNDHPLGLPGILESFPKARVISTSITRDLIRTETNTPLGKTDPEVDAARLKRSENTIAELKQEAAAAGVPADMRANYEIETGWIAERVKRQTGNYVVLPTEFVSGSLTIPDPVAPVELHVLGTANTTGDLIAWLPRQKIAVAGDAVVLPTPYGFTVSTKPWLESLARLERLPFSILIPGHGRVQHDRAYFRTLQWSMTDLAAKAQAAAASGLDKEKAFAAFDQTEQRQRFGATDAWTRKWLSDYWLQGMFETAFDEAKGIPAPGK